ncbi:hypothetical protein [Neptunomonas sp.]|uniref:hypothetical protein n=1 Tax=Neptunomonas sp. TaxID=1971898 RepID=UPI0035665B03
MSGDFQRLFELSDEELAEIAQDKTKPGTMRRLANEHLIDRTIESAIRLAVNSV